MCDWFHLFTSMILTDENTNSEANDLLKDNSRSCVWNHEQKAVLLGPGLFQGSEKTPDIGYALELMTLDWARIHFSFSSDFEIPSF